MILRSLGCVYKTEDFRHFSSHAQVPTPIVLNDIIRVYYAARDTKNKSYITYADFDRNDPTRLLNSLSRPVLEPAAIGTFDEDGCMPGHVLPVGNELWLYYTGWNQKVSTPYHNAIGLARSKDGGQTFHRAFFGPVMDRTAEEPYIAVTPYVILENGNFRCWYCSGTEWITSDGRIEPVYVIKSAISTDGIHWDRTQESCLPSNFKHETCTNPTVFFADGLYRMLFCFRGPSDYRGNGAHTYRLGYATSSNSLQWDRKDKQLIKKDRSGEWENEMQCYPFYLRIGDRSFIYYNGNGFGQTGFGIYEIEEV